MVYEIFRYYQQSSGPEENTKGRSTQPVEEIRERLLEVVPITGGHLASNLGVVELTIALHYIFDTPTTLSYGM